ncbi:YidE/YbjL duplication [Fimbriimonas ginsengisoli Gsoil 348]|uniref:YidE/YbjL duplication n=1 Tax=Fimbriimonas ginsengisoli Gsoil 348 TaxID=661478 RepID=A0A068NSL9_FIMGI|nr:YidE/YbjL duplication [Fimbriimonas ginsengisoli Gsoil 348]
MVRLLGENPLLLLFAVCAIGYPLGRMRIRGVSLGTASVLFVGIAIGAVDPRLKLPDVVYLFGLTLFIYTIGLNSAAGFFKGFDRRGIRDTALALGVLALAGVADYLLARAANMAGATGSAMYSGAFTNASGLAGVVESVKAAGGTGKALAEPVVGYSLAYPIGIFGPIMVMLLAQRLFGVDLQKEALTVSSYRRSIQKIEVRTIEVTNPAAAGMSVVELTAKQARDVVFGRVLRSSEVLLASGDLKIQLGDRIATTGPEAELDTLTEFLGQISDEEVHLDRTEFDVRRMFVSNPSVAGRPLSQLALPQLHQAVITRVGRGDIDLIPSGDTILELGDRVRVLARRDEMGAVERIFGDSYRALADVDFRTLCIGIALGLMLGLLPIPLPGGITFRLGFAGGPLVVALLLGRLERTGPLVWNLPYTANLTLRQLGLLLFAAGIGTRAGYDFYSTLAGGHGLNVFTSGAAMTLGSGLVMMVVGYKLLKIPLNLLYGIYAGAQTQPVNLAFAVDRTGNDLPNARYATIFPLATIFKILVAQVLFNVLR